MNFPRIATEAYLISAALDKTGISELFLAAREIRRVVTPLRVGADRPTVELADATMSDSGVEQSWMVRFKGREKEVRTLTSSSGDVSVLNGGSGDMGIWRKGEEDDWSPLTTASEAVMFIIRKAHPRYYPALGERIVIDSDFISDLKKSRPIS